VRHRRALVNVAVDLACSALPLTLAELNVLRTLHVLCTPHGSLNAFGIAMRFALHEAGHQVHGPALISISMYR